MTPDALASRLRDALGDAVLDVDPSFDQLTVTVEPSAFPQAAQVCKEASDLACTFFDFLTGVDEREDGFAVVAHVYSPEHRHSVTLRAVAPGGREQPRMPSLTGVYRGANWHERETYDMFGVVFEGHPGLLPRILTSENFEGWPLRKDFKLTTRLVKPWPGDKEPEDRKEREADTGAAAAGGEASADAPQDKEAAAREKAERAKAKAAEARRRRAQEQAAALEDEDADGGGTGSADEES